MYMCTQFVQALFAPLMRLYSWARDVVPSLNVNFLIDERRYAYRNSRSVARQRLRNLTRRMYALNAKRLLGNVEAPPHECRRKKK